MAAKSLSMDAVLFACKDTINLRDRQILHTSLSQERGHAWDGTPSFSENHVYGMFL
jgi:hypothetical protein